MALGGAKSWSSVLPAGAVFVLAVMIVLTTAAKAAAAEQDPGCGMPGACGARFDFRCESFFPPHFCEEQWAKYDADRCQALYEMRADKCATCNNLKAWFDGTNFDPKACPNGVGYVAKKCDTKS